MSFNYTNLKNNPEHYQNLIKLIENEFHYQNPHSFEQDFYPLVAPSNWEHCHLLLDDKNFLIGHIGIKIKTITLQSEAYQFAFIGGIAIHSEFQGKGLFRLFFENVIKIYQESVCTFFLWSDQHELYRKFDFSLCIGQIETIPNKNGAGTWEQVTLASLNTNEIEQIKKLYQYTFKKNFLSFDRNQNDWDLIKKISSANLYIYREQGMISSYYLKDKGQDLSKIVHEFGYKNEEVKRKLYLELSSQTAWLPEELKSIFPNHHLHFATLTRLGNPIQFSRFISEWSSQQINLQMTDNFKFEFKFEDKIYSLAFVELMHALFGPSPQFHKLGPSLYFCGLDSI